MSPDRGDSAGSPGAAQRPYYCGWAITFPDPTSHLIASPDFPTVGSRRRAWCGEMITVIGLTLDVRRPILHCPDCNQWLQRCATTDRCR